MALKDALMPEFDHETGVTRRLLERVPEQDLAWRPHEKSRSLGELAAHLVYVPTWTRWITELSEFDLASEAGRPPNEAPTSVRELLARFDANAADARRRLDELGDGQLTACWTLKRDGHVVYVVPRIAALRSFLMNHSVHHRGQLSVYLRLRNVPLPAMYGPTADEG